jgi:transcriptional regulator of acetoin/glycerol metabolism
MSNSTILNETHSIETTSAAPSTVIEHRSAGGIVGDWKPSLDGEGKVRSFDAYEAEIFRFALDNAGGCVSRAAELLGVGRATMYRKMRAYSIIAPPVSERAIDRSRRPSKDDVAESLQ